MEHSILSLSLMCVRNNANAYGGTHTQIKEEFAHRFSVEYVSELDISEIKSDTYLKACYDLGFDNVVRWIKFNPSYYDLKKLCANFYCPINSFDNRLSPEGLSKCATAYLLGYVHALKSAYKGE